MEQDTHIQALKGLGFYNEGKLTRDQQADGLEHFVEGWRALESGARRLAADLNNRAAPLKTAFGNEILVVMGRLTLDARIVLFNELHRQNRPITTPDPLVALLRHEQAVGTLTHQQKDPRAALDQEKGRFARLNQDYFEKQAQLSAHPEADTLADLIKRFPEQTEQLMTDPNTYPPPTNWGRRRWEAVKAVCSSGPEGDFAKALRQARRQHPQFDTTVQTVLAPLIREARQLTSTLDATRADVQRLETAVAGREELEASVLAPARYPQVLAEAFAPHANTAAQRAREIGMETTAGNIVRTHADWTAVRKDLAAGTSLVGAIRSPPDHTAYAWLRPVLMKPALRNLAPACFTAMGTWLEAGDTALNQMQTTIASGAHASFGGLPPHPYFQPANKQCPASIDTILHNAKLVEAARSKASGPPQIQTRA